MGARLGYFALLIGAMGLQAPAISAVLSATTEQAATPLAPSLMLAKPWSAGQSPTGFLVSEKLDGVRAVWDGQRLRFRSGLPIAAPVWFVEALPPVALDGELWLGRGQFERLVGIVRHQEPVEADWREVSYMLFDLPGSTEPFEQRAQRVQEVVQRAGQPWLQAVPQRRVEQAADLQRLLDQLVRDGGEGWVLHRANALWAPGRSDALFKFKPKLDEEARVVAHLPGKGRHAGRLGALLLELPSGQRFALGTGFTDLQRESPPPLGSVVTYCYSDKTAKGLPRFASFWRVRAVE